MAKNTLSLKHIGPIQSADIEFGDLTIFVGPQATGKSIALQTLKLVLDAKRITSRLALGGLDWGDSVSAFFDLYFGEGCGSMWIPENTEIITNGIAKPLSDLIAIPDDPSDDATCIFAPAQRILSYGSDGWPRAFDSFRAGDPFVLREFSETIRGLADTSFRRLNRPRGLPPTAGSGFIQHFLSEHIFRGFELQPEKNGLQWRLVLSGRGPRPLPFMVWSAGQREFVPLLLLMELGLYPAIDSVTRPKWVVIEEPEMGLHPAAIRTFMLMILDLAALDYKICLSTHSPQILDFAWALRILKDNRGGLEDVMRLMGIDEIVKNARSAQAASVVDMEGRRFAKSTLERSVRVHYFDPATGQSKDISALDPGADDAAEAGWGGLTAFSGEVADVVADVVARAS